MKEAKRFTTANYKQHYREYIFVAFSKLKYNQKNTEGKSVFKSN